MDTTAAPRRITLADLRAMKAAGRKFAMLTAYDHPTAALAQAAGVHALLVGDSMGTVLLGHADTRSTPLGLMVILAEAVRRGAPHCWLVGDLPYEAVRTGADFALAASRRFCDRAGCDAVKCEVARDDAAIVRAIAGDGIDVIAHIGLRPQRVMADEGFRVQARDPASIEALAEDARQLVAAGAAMILLEAVPNEAAAAVVCAVDVPVVGCGAGPACDGHVVVTHDMLGWRTTVRTPRFVPVLADVGARTEAAMREYAQQIASGVYPGPEHVYKLLTPVSEKPY